MTNAEMWDSIIEDVKTTYGRLRPEDAYVPSERPPVPPIRPNPRLDHYVERGGPRIRPSRPLRTGERDREDLNYYPNDGGVWTAFFFAMIGLMFGLIFGYLIWGWAR